MRNVRVAWYVPEGVPAHAKARAEMLADYTTNAGQGDNVIDWLAVAKEWSENGGCEGNPAGVPRVGRVLA